MKGKQISHPSPTTASSKKRIRWTPTRQFVMVLLTFAVLLNSVSLFSSVAIWGCNGGSNTYTGNALSVPGMHSTALANNQSYGYFDDIHDSSWKRMQQRARGFVQYMHPKEPEKGYENTKFWYLDNLQPDFTCPHVNRVGGHGDGPKWTCDPHRLLDRKDCLIYSIGSEGNYAWEDALIALLGSPHCEIHVFDHGDYARGGDPENKNIHFHQWGLKSYNDPHKPDLLLTFEETVKQLGHKSRRIDILKIDCETCEWSTYKDWISEHIDQVLIETHGVPSPVGANEWYPAPMKVSKFFDAFRENNFAMFSKEVNVYGNGSFIEFGYVKLRPEFWEINERESFFGSLPNWLWPFSRASASDCQPDFYMDAPHITIRDPTLLAKSQSYGYFDDIPDNSWKLMQERARSSVQYMHPLQPEYGHEDPILWYMNNLQPDFTCTHIRRLGGHGDGPKFTCDPHRLVDAPDCLIYSIGSEGKYEWEDSLIDEIGSTQCEIHVFDPVDYSRPGDPERRNIHYHAWGLKSSYDEAYNAMITLNALNGTQPNLISFPETVRMLGHDGRRIDILKIDCEKCEWANYKDWISLDIRQVLIETHGVPSPVEGNKWHHAPMQVADLFDTFRANNFAMFSKEVNVHGYGNCVEFSYIKLHPDFWRDGFMTSYNHSRKQRSVSATSPAAMLATRGVGNSLQQAEPVQKFAFPVAVRNHQSAGAPKIPRHFIFAYQWNILEHKSPPLLYNNILNTVQKYKEAWGEEDVPVGFIDDQYCRSAIRAAKPELMRYFYDETNESFKADICLMAALYLDGGYYFDVELEVLQAYTPSNAVSFLTVIDSSAKRVFLRVMATAPSSPILEKTLEVMLNYYKLSAFNRPDINLGPVAMGAAVQTVNAATSGNVHVLKEIPLDDFPLLYPDVPRREGEGCCCNHAVHDPDGPVPTVFFYSRIVGSYDCMPPMTVVDLVQ